MVLAAIVHRGLPDRTRGLRSGKTRKRTALTDLAWCLSGVLAMALAAPAWASQNQLVQPHLADGPTVSVDQLVFADLDRDGVLAPFEDWRLTAEARADDLVSRLSLAEKAGLLMHGTAPASMAYGVVGYDLQEFEKTNREAHVFSVITRLAGEPKQLAEANNDLQRIARGSRFSIPLTISTDPRNHFQFVPGASVRSTGFSQWPEPLGFAAIGDPELVRHFADIARREYRAVGIHMALSPQADLATEPRWSRMTATFGEDPGLAGTLVGAYVEGFQNGATGVGPDSVIAVVKHWVGYGAGQDGLDGHNAYGAKARLDNDALEQHIQPFRPSFAAKVAGVMPTYDILDGVTINGQASPRVGSGYNRLLLQDLLRDQEGFKGLVISDWGITNDCNAACRTGKPAMTPQDIGMPWGVEDLTITQRFALGLEAGLDQFGGTETTDRLVDAVSTGLTTEARLDVSSRRVLSLKFALGLFEDPFVDPAAAAAEVGTPQALADGVAAQSRSIVMLERGRRVPVANGAKVFLHGVAADAARAAGLVPVATLAEADVAIVRIAAPFETLHPGFFFGQRQHEGSLDFLDDSADLAAVRDASALKPTIVSVFLDRPAILTRIKPLATALFGDFGAGDDALLAVITGREIAEGRLPFALPSDMESVRAQNPGRPDDLAHPLYPRGYRAP